MHGVPIDRPWEVVESHGTSATLRCGFDGRWPWRGHAVQTVTLAPDGLDAVLEVHGDDAPMPAWSGWHPWFARRLGRGADVRIDLSARGMLVRDDDGLPSGVLAPVPEGPWDDCFADVAWPVTLTWDDALRLEVSSDSRYAVVFDEKPGAVCVEPQTAPPDAAALGLATTVEPGAPLRMTMTWRWRAT
jgi:aldose 1-epimerase